jgi:hypothetical protein
VVPLKGNAGYAVEKVLSRSTARNTLARDAEAVDTWLRGEKMPEITITIDTDPKSPMSMERFILTVLNEIGSNSAQVATLLSEFNKYRLGMKKKSAKYASFRVIISNLNAEGYIESTSKNRVNPFDPSFYKITEAGRRRLLFLSNR